MSPLVPALLLVTLVVSGCARATGLEPVHDEVAATTAPPAPALATSRPDPVHVTLDVVPVRQVALTFDDGPGPHTPQVLQALVAADAVATFFVLGNQLPGKSDVIADLVEAGMSVQWHTRTHPDLTRLSDTAAVAELTVPKALVAAGASPSCVRPPYGATDARVSALAASIGLTQELWTLDPRDWAATDPYALVDAVMNDLEDGDVVLLHDGGGDRSVTVEALPHLLERLSNEGFRTVRLCD